MPISLIFATLASISVSGGDFVAGLASRRTPSIIVAFVSESIGLILLLGALLFVPHLWPSSFPLTPLAMGLAAGVCATLNINLLYQGFAVGTMGIVAPLEAVVGTAIPVTVGLIAGDRIPALGVIGILCALTTPLLLAHQSAGAENAQRKKSSLSIAYGLGSGLCLGGVFVFLGKAGGSAGMGPLVMERVATVTLTLLISSRLKLEGKPSFPALKLAALGGLLDIIAHSLYFMSTWKGNLAIVSVIYSLYPAGTIILARAILKEQLGRLQIAGVLCALCGIALLVYGTYP
ncbi:MAG TPA: EamA family transporter [Candidatus Saccharimonadales bacterium]|jgi:drug/metabolite transporter (DMT)-like permease|nr:EamA family transporter [Candidatus Saccharimonadales bacterium]